VIGADSGITVAKESVNGDDGSLTQDKPILEFAFAEKG